MLNHMAQAVVMELVQPDGFAALEDRRFPNGFGIKCSVIKPAYNPYIIHI